MDQQPHLGWRSTDLAVIATGLLTSALVLLFVHWLGDQINDFNIMGWYLLFIIPAGAILVGIGAGSGYGFMSWRTGRKITGSLLIVNLALLALTYALAQWIEFVQLNLERYGVDFFEYFDATTRGMTLKIGRSQASTGNLGLLGYLFRLLELVGFSLGGLFIPILLRAKPYCESCQIYMRRGTRWWLPAAVAQRKISKRDRVAVTAYQRDMEEAHKKGIDLRNKLVALARERDATSFRSILERESLQAKEANKLFGSIELVLHACPQCRNGELETSLRQGQGDKTKVTSLGRERLNAGFVAALGEIRPRQNLPNG